MKEKKKAGKEIKMTRRSFMGVGAAFAAFTIVPRHVLAGSGQQAPSDKANIAGVGVGGQGGGDIRGCGNENIYALCDIDEVKAGPTFAQYYTGTNGTKLYKDFRKMFDKEADNIDGVICGTPDHMHASVAIWAMERGIGAYVEKPLTQSVWEARLLKKAQQKYPNVATQMGNQGYSAEATRLAAEMIWNGDFGEITDVHAWYTGNFARGIVTWPEPEPIPETLQWDLFTGRAREHTYSSKIHPYQWRGFLEYGTHMIGDWGIHVLGPANLGLGLSYTYPTSVTCIEVSGVNPVTYPDYTCIYEFPERAHPTKAGQKMQPVKIHWTEGEKARNSLAPVPEGMSASDFARYNEVLYGTKGILGTSGRGESLSPVPRSSTIVKPPEVLPRVRNGHIGEWLTSLKGGPKSLSNFSNSAPYAEWMLLGTISWRFPNEKLMWDGENLRFKNNDKANEFIRPYMRKGWELEDITL
ncbi:MAG: Gfo/Idh/MocA family oxidoreductase [Sedimentisphaerales bacterium]|nr:Gfo/Idh/MocA family oxidoreductase [Sedimentisphaerales bacterium]